MNSTTSVIVLMSSLALLVICNVIFDIWVIYNYGTEASISAGMRDLPSMLVFWLGFCIGGTIGLLTAHFWFPPPSKE